MTSPNFMVIGFQIRKLHRGAESAPPAVLDSKKPGLFRVNIRTNVKINLDGEQAKLKDEPAAKPKGEGIVKTKPDVKQKRNLTSSPIKNTNNMPNLTSSSNMMLRW